MKKGLSRRDLFASTGAALGAALVGGAAARKALGVGVGTGIPRWGIAVDLARCASQAGCRACINACHSAHRVPKVEDARHEVKWVWKEPFARVFPEQVHSYEPEARLQAPVLVMCNHCTQSPCTRVCPTGATWRRSDGVVAMDEHRCIGCRYCMAACPYGSRSFNWEEPRSNSGASDYPMRTAGVVEKCTLCVERIDVGQIPLCVETCEKLGAAALTFGNLEDANAPLRQLLATRQVLRRRPSLGTEPRVFYLVA
jgi:molybdopterin-containing oxidoreductase family iron-sulfur binding subunit